MSMDSTDMTSRSEQWETINERYEDYLRSYPNESNINIKLEDEIVDYPLSWGHQTGRSVIIDSIEPIDTHYLLSFDDSAPKFEDLYLREKADFPILLTKIGQVKSTQDHRKYWRYSLKELSDFFGGSTNEYDTLLEILEIAVLLSCMVTTKESDPSYLRKKSYFIATYVTFPLIEALLKGFCEEDIRMDGEVKPGHRIRRLGSSDSYFTEGEICSDIGSLFFHLEEEIADDYLKNSLEEFREYIAKFGDGNADLAYGQIKDWRNGLLHGEKRPIGQFLINMNIVFFLMWHFVRDIYN